MHTLRVLVDIPNFCNCIADEVDESAEEIKTKPDNVSTKKSKNRPEKTIRRKQLKAKSKVISGQIKKRKLMKKKQGVRIPSK